MSVKVRLDNGGVAELLKSSGVASVVNGYGDRVAASAASAPEVTRHGMEVSASSGVSDRARSIVTIMHAGGLGVQAKHGTLTRAVSDVGLEFRGAAS